MALTDDQAKRLENMLTDIQAAAKELTDWERNFIEDQVKRFDQYGDKMFLSPKQMAVIERIYDKIGGQQEVDDTEFAPRDDDEIPF